MKIKFFISGIFFTLVAGLYANQQLTLVFPENQNCVAYMTNKSMIMQDSVDVIGMNCSVTVTRKMANNNTVVTTTIPLDKFDSGEKGRDKFVFKYLEGETRPSLLFTSKPYSASGYRQLLGGSGNLEGKLTIGNKEFPVVVDLTRKGDYLTGQLITKFSYFGLEPPVAGPFGLVARVRDYLELHFQIDVNSIQ